uniref:Protein with SprT-like domain at the N terminus n=1 Tax=Onchocerca volvulus TaxID=6282 RepID=A0A2K6VLF4_ONCVO
MSKKIFELKDLQHVHTLQDTSPKKKRYSFPATNPSSSSINSCHPNSLVDPIWEVIDPTPNLHALFQQYDDTYFNGALAACEVKWSSRMTSCAGLCSFESKSKFCSIRLSKPLLQYRPRKDLVETLLHEMIHAALFLSDGMMDRDGHGPKFQYHMHRINMRAGTNITIYHNFHNEVRYHQKHWWRCTGPCRMRSPFYGWVKRSMNRPPSKNDFWWKEHQMTCGGNFIKIKEPEGYSTKKKMSQASNGKSQPQILESPLNRYFPGTGHVLGRLSSSAEDISSCNLNMDRPENRPGSSGMRLKMPSVENYNTKNDLRVPKIILTAEENIATITMPKNCSGLLIKDEIAGSSRKCGVGNVESIETDVMLCVPCPVCNAYVSENTINSHLDSCLAKTHDS